MSFFIGIEIEGTDYFYLPLNWVSDLNCQEIIKSFIDKNGENYRLVLGPRLMKKDEKIDDIIDMNEFDYMEGYVHIRFRLVNVEAELYLSKAKGGNLDEKKYTKKVVNKK